ncbi:MAG: S8 family serine peptidase [Myxococcales bacterium]|nr:S8 family serine peptidase [Myxococcales bacterium]
MKKSGLAGAWVFGLGVIMAACQGGADVAQSSSGLQAESAAKAAPEKSVALEHRPPIQYPDDPNWIPYEPGVVVVKFRAGVDRLSAASIAKSLGLSVVEYRKPLDLYRMGLSSKETPEEAARRIARDPRVAYAEPNWKIRLLNTPNDPRYSEDWGMNNTGQTGGTPDADIDAPEAWDISIGSYDVVVAVLDTGVDYTHPDLAANMWTNADEIAGNGIDDDNNGYIDDVRGWDFEHQTNDPMDDYGHGTHCSGIIGAVGNNSLGVAGVNWRVTIMPLRIIGNQELEDYCVDAAEAIHYAVDNGARVMSCSWWTVQHYSQTLENAVAYANSMGVILVAAAGNGYPDGIGKDTDDPSTMHWPSSWPYDNIIAVAATTHTDQKASFSNYGLVTVDVGAPGEDILSTIWPGGGYDLMSGTSMATPHVAGLCALMFSIRPDLDMLQVKNTLIGTIDPVADLQGRCVSGGRVNALRALQAISGVPLPPVALAGGNQTVPTGTHVTLDGSHSFDPNGDPISHEWQFYRPANSSAVLSSTTAPAPTFDADVCGEYQGILTVTDSTGLISNPDRARVVAVNQTALNPVVESAHPYADNFDYTWTITQPGAVVIGVHFASFDTEQGYDFVHVLDANDVEVASYSGALGAFSTPVVTGNTIKLRLTSDSSVNRNGFVADAITWCDAGRCPPGLGDCDDDPATGPDGCETNTASSTQNCGWCGHACAAPHAVNQCVAGMCQVAGCESGWFDCNNDFADGCESNPLIDPQNCGLTGCGNPTCGPVPHGSGGCAGGQCTVGTCEAGWGDCDGNVGNGCERDVTADVQNCGTCGNVCNLPHATGHSCIDGVCYPSTCQDSAEDVQSPHPYPHNYNNTWTITRPGASVMSVHFSMLNVERNWDFVRVLDGNDSEIATYTGQYEPFWSPNVPGSTVKVNFTSDSSVAYDGFTIDMVRACLGACEAGYGDCDGLPANGCEASVQSDVDNCGGCGVVCGYPHMDSQCVGGTCQPGTSCLAGWGDCDGVATNGCETDLTSSAQHCSACGSACTYDHASGVCNNGTCELGNCASGYANCNDSPSDGCEVQTSTDPQNCGSCGNVCTLDHASAGCAAGECRVASCEVGWGDCDHAAANGCEQPVVDDPANCGACGRTCNSLPHATGHCEGVDCAIDSCATGWGNCDGAGFNGCESLVGSDPENCGQCGNACTFANASALCVGGQCQLDRCIGGFNNCNNDPADGCESNYRTDPENCGSCGRRCEAAHATANCVGGYCGIAACDEGWTDCNHALADGCEVHTGEDAQNCGACGVLCRLSHATAACHLGQCVVGSCDIGYADCNGDAADGCEVDTRSDAQNCGACGTSCALAHAVSACDASACVITRCEADFGNCDGQTANGCEADLTSDEANCGRCGIECGNGQECREKNCLCPDDDGDGYAKPPCGNDCDDTRQGVHPNTAEICGDQLDNNCDGLTDSDDQVACPKEETSGGGCGCGTGASGGSGLLMLLGLSLLGIKRRK